MKIFLRNGKENKEIELNNRLKIFFKEYNIIFIDFNKKDYEYDEYDDIKNILDLDENIFIYKKPSYSKETIFLLNYPNNEKKDYFLGTIKEKEENNVISKDETFLGIPILKSSNSRIIGFHIDSNKNSGYNKGLSFKYFLKELIYEKDLEISLSKNINNGVYKRLFRDLKKIKEETSSLYTFHPTYDHPYTWEATLIGPENSPYKGGIFHINFNFYGDYPYRPPTFEFSTKLFNRYFWNDFHFDISFHKELLKVLGRDKWTPDLWVYNTLDLINSVFNDELDVGCNISVIVDGITSYDAYLNNREKYEKIAREWTKQYADIDHYY